jgi:predicted DNA-binding protein (MmcQ/YjbR family)
MNSEQLREYCLSKPNVTEGFPFGPDTLVMKTNDKVFILVSLDTQPLQFNVKCEPEKAIALREEYETVIPGYHMNKKHWNTIICDGTLSTKFLKEQVDHSYELVSKKKVKK